MLCSGEFALILLLILNISSLSMPFLFLGSLFFVETQVSHLLNVVVVPLWSTLRIRHVRLVLYNREFVCVCPKGSLML